jgi:hypothetical protein
MGGVRVAVIGDINGDGPGIVTGAGPGGGPHLQDFDPLTASALESFYAYTQSFVGGFFVGGN